MKKVNFTAVLSLIILCAVLLPYNAALPDSFLQAENTGFTFDGNADISVMGGYKNDEGDKICLGLFGVLPVKFVDVSSTERPYLTPCGTPFGVKLLTDGAVVTGFGSVAGASPAEKAGIRKGDIITEVNGVEITSSQALSDAVQLDAKSAAVTLDRNGEIIKTKIAPELSEDGVYRLGIWTRDSCAGIGTMTFYDAKTGTFGGLGHAVCDIDSGREMPLGSGEIVPVSICSIIRGYSGKPGELIGSFMSDISVGNIALNSECGVFGKAEGVLSVGNALPMAFRQEVKTGAATILTTVSGMEPREYDIVIEKIDYNRDAASRNMTIRVTDTELLAKTGGIVQGMSGSPILQDGYIIGAVTHVFVNNATRGYGVFAENMYYTGCSSVDFAA